MIAVLFTCLLLVTMVGVRFSDSIDNFTDDLRVHLGLGLTTENSDGVFTPDPALFTSPAIPGYSPIKKETAPIRKTLLQPGFTLSSNYQISDFFRGGVGYFKISIKNRGQNPIFIYRYGVSANASKNRTYSRDCETLFSPGEEKKVLEHLQFRCPKKKKLALTSYSCGCSPDLTR